MKPTRGPRSLVAVLTLVLCIALGAVTVFFVTRDKDDDEQQVLKSFRFEARVEVAQARVQQAASPWISCAAPTRPKTRRAGTSPTPTRASRTTARSCSRTGARSGST